MGSTFGARRYHFDWRSFITPGVKLLVLVCTGVFLVQTFLGLLAPPAATIWLLKWFALIPEAVTHHIPPRIWQPFTYIFMHGGLFHLLINMLMLWMFGRDLELVWGKRRFLNYFCICGVGAGLMELIVKTIPVFLGGMLLGYLYLRPGSFFHRVPNTASDWQHDRNHSRVEVHPEKRKQHPTPP